MRFMIFVVSAMIIGVFTFDRYGLKVKRFFNPPKTYRYDFVPPVAENLPPTIRINSVYKHDPKDEAISVCSGVIISPTLALTAKHCVMRENSRGLIELPTEVKVYSLEEPTLIELPAEVARISYSEDVAAISGDFKLFNGAPMYNDQLSVLQYVPTDPQAPLRVVGNCGFPYNSKSIACFSMIPVIVTGKQIGRAHV